MDQLSQENRTLIQAAINAVHIQLSRDATAAERHSAGQVREKRCEWGEKRGREKGGIRQGKVGLQELSPFLPLNTSCSPFNTFF